MTEGISNHERFSNECFNSKNGDFITEASTNDEFNPSNLSWKNIFQIKSQIKEEKEHETIDLHELSEFSSKKPIHLNRNQCPICFGQFDLEKSYVEHMWQVHGNKRPFRCDDCGLYLSYRSSLYNHRKIHSDKRPFGCTECVATFRWNNSLKYHMKRAHNKEPPWVVSRGVPFMRRVEGNTSGNEEAQNESGELGQISMIVKLPCLPSNEVSKNDTNSTSQGFPNKSANSTGNLQNDANSQLHPQTVVCTYCDHSFASSEYFHHERICVKKSIMEVIHSISGQSASKSIPIDSRMRNPRKSKPPTKFESFDLLRRREKIAKKSRLEMVDNETFSTQNHSVSAVGRPLNEKLCQLGACQDSLVRRMENLEQWVHERVGKMETILAALVAGSNLASRTLL